MFNLGEISMKKTLVALAALAATGAFAQSSVTLYGVADVYLGSIKSSTRVAGLTTNLTQTVINSAGINGSRFGLKGSEDLGGGLKANFQLENGFNIDNSSFAAGTDVNGVAAAQPNLFGRQAYVGLSGNFGAVNFGRQYTSYDETRGGNDPQGHSGFSATAGGAWAAGRDYTYRVNNSMKYDTPNFGGFSAGLTYALSENKTATVGAGTVLALKAGYANGPIAVAFAHQVEKNIVTGQGTGIAATATNEKHTLVTGSYNFGVAKLGLGFNTSKDNATPAAPGADKEFQIGVNVPLGATELIADYATSKAAANATSNGHKARAIALEARYALSKRTGAYFAFRNVKSDVTYNTTGPDNGTKSNAIGLGIRHFF
jgi:predicted porin